MTGNAKFFEDNIARINQTSDPVLSNLNNGLLTMCQQLDRIESNQRNLAQALRRLEDAVSALQSR